MEGDRLCGSAALRPWLVSYSTVWTTRDFFGSDQGNLKSLYAQNHSNSLINNAKRGLSSLLTLTRRNKDRKNATCAHSPSFEGEENGHAAFAKSCVTVRRPVKTYITPAEVENAPKTNFIMLMMKFRRSNETSPVTNARPKHPHRQQTHTSISQTMKSA